MKFDYAISVTENPEVFGAITINNRWKHNHEKKVRDDTTKCDRVDSRIVSQGPHIRLYVDKMNPPKEWVIRNRRKLMLEILSYTMNQTLQETMGDVYVVMDQHTA